MEQQKIQQLWKGSEKDAKHQEKGEGSLTASERPPALKRSFWTGTFLGLLAHLISSVARITMAKYHRQNTTELARG